jgi:signal transduction histidine kinase
MSSIFSIFSLLTALVAAATGLIVMLKRHDKVAKSWGLLSLSVLLWSLGLGLMVISPTKTEAFFWCLIHYLGCIFVPAAYLHFIFTLIGIQGRQRRAIIIGYIAATAIFFLYLNGLIVKDVIPKMGFHYYTVPSKTYFIFPIFFSLYVSYAIFELLRCYLGRASGLLRNQLKYIVTASLVGFIGGSSTFLAVYDIAWYHWGNCFVFLYPLIIAYAIVKHRLMDIRLAITKAGIFFAVYALTLGIPFWIGYQTKSWVLATAFMALLATAGPIAHRILQRKAEAALLQKQVRQQEALLKFADTVSQIRNTRSLFKETLTNTFEIMQPEFARLYVYSLDKKTYILQDSLDVKECPLRTEFISEEPLIGALEVDRKPVFLETVRDMPQVLHEAIALPFHENVKRRGLAGFLILGPKKDNTLYNQQDLNSFEILSIQVSLSLENCIFWEDEKTRLAREEQIKRAQAMDHFSASFVHEVGNPLFAAVGQVTVINNILTQDIGTRFTPQQALERIKPDIELIQHTLDRLSKMVKALKDFTGQNTEEFSLVDFDEIIENFGHIVKPLMKIGEMGFMQEVDQGVKLIGNKINLEEILVNFATNSMYAVKNCNPPLANQEARITLKAHKVNGNKFLMEFSDNGCGIPKHLLEDIFLDFVTTKASSVSSGIGLGIVRKIVTRHGGKIWAQSEGENKGAAFFVELPLPTAAQIEERNKAQAEAKKNKHKL